MARFSTAVLVATVLCMMNENTQAFVGSNPSLRPTVALSMMEEGNNIMGRRQALLAGVAAAFVAAPQTASAKYSDYSRREKDWDERMSKGEIKVSTARDLRAQLQEIAPMNTSSSKIFCPNGPSASVSPLMENKCGDRLATPSVFGRQNDVMGNSIPGFKEGYFSSGSSSMSASIGGFPAYKENEWKMRDLSK